MKKLIIITGVIIYLSVAVSFFTGGATEKNPVVMQNSQSMINVDNETGNEDEYVLTVSDGVIIVKNHRGDVVKTTDTRVEILPEQDRSKLFKGIEVDSKKELDRLLEDFCS